MQGMRKNKKLWVVLGAVVILAFAGAATWIIHHRESDESADANLTTRRQKRINRSKRLRIHRAASGLWEIRLQQRATEERICPEQAAKLHSDTVHYNAYGAAYAAGLIAQQMHEAGLACCQNIRTFDEVVEETEGLHELEEKEGITLRTRE